MAYHLHHKKAEQWLKTLPDNSKDGCLSDFPYGLKFMGKKWDYDLPSIEALTELYRVLKPGAFLLGFSSSRTYHRLAVRLEDIGFEIRDCIMWLYGSGFPKAFNIGKAFQRAHNNVLAYTFDGWGACLKPAYEPIVVAMKPIHKSILNNAALFGVAGLNIDECRIETNWRIDPNGRETGKKPSNTQNTYGKDTRSEPWFQTKGRYPSNIILSPISAKEIDYQSGISANGHRENGKKVYLSTLKSNVYQSGGAGTGLANEKFWDEKRNDFFTYSTHYNDMGGASRFFYCAKASPSDRNYGLPTGNKHPTVKPIKLARYLAKLIKTPFSEAQYINPYSGSGTEMIGFILEGMNVEGCEMEERSYNDAELRCQHAFKSIDIQTKLFE